MIDTDRILAIDVGGGTQDILVYEADKPIENCPKLVLPSRTAMLGGRVRRATERGRAVFFTGNLMGGGPVKGALKKHVASGLAAFATPLAAKTFHDSPERVRDMGVEIVDEPPDGDGVVTLHTRDVDVEALAEALRPFDVVLPETRAVAVQDHGESLEGSNRKFRFDLWRRLLEAGGLLRDLVYLTIPPAFTRMQAVQNDLPGAVLMDTGAAAVWGALADEQVGERRDEGVVVVNAGNQHTLGVLVRGARVWGLFEHHTVMMTAEKLTSYVDRLRRGTLTNEEVFDDRGHGCFIRPDLPGDFPFVAVTGPQRYGALGLGYYLAVPHGDMMLSGCFGLVDAVKAIAETG
ncbi:MAG: pyruvate formate lyase-activating protein [Actinobacteria bacterium]|nr:MAG: pyruvate formate lyase-activating protein [Actinomycetota bacterium]